MKNYTEEEIKAFMSPDIPKIPIVRITDPTIKNLIDYGNNIDKMRIENWRFTEESSEIMPVLVGNFTILSDGSALVTNNNSNVGFYRNKPFPPQPITEVGYDYVFTAEIKNISDVFPEFDLALYVTNDKASEWIHLNDFETEELPNNWVRIVFRISIPNEYSNFEVYLFSGDPLRPWTNQYYFRNLNLYTGSQEPARDIIIPPSRIIAESLDLNHILDGNKTISFWGCNSASLKIQIAGLEKDYRNYGIDISIECGGYLFDMFSGFIYEQTNQNQEDLITTLTCYDYMKKIYELNLTLWWRWQVVTNPNIQRTIAEVLDLFLIELTWEIPQLICDHDAIRNLVPAYPSPMTPVPNLSELGILTGEKIIKMLAQAAGLYFYFDGNELKARYLSEMVEGLHPHIGLHPHKGLYPSGGSYDSDFAMSEYISATYEPFKTSKIDGVRIINANGDDVGTYPALHKGNCLYIADNLLINAISTKDMNRTAEVMYGRVKNRYLTPSKIQALYDPRIEVGDVIKVYTKNNVIYSYVLAKEIKGIQAMFVTYTNKSEQNQPIPNKVK